MIRYEITKVKLRMTLIDEIKKILCDLHVHIYIYIYISLLDLLYAYFFVSQVIIERTTRQIHPESHLTF